MREMLVTAAAAATAAGAAAIASLATSVARDHRGGLGLAQTGTERKSRLRAVASRAVRHPSALAQTWAHEDALRATPRPHPC